MFIPQFKFNTFYSIGRIEACLLSSGKLKYTFFNMLKYQKHICKFVHLNILKLFLYTVFLIVSVCYVMITCKYAKINEKKVQVNL